MVQVREATLEDEAAVFDLLRQLMMKVPNPLHCRNIGRTRAKKNSAAIKLAGPDICRQGCHIYGIFQAHQDFKHRERSPRNRPAGNANQ